MQLNNQLARLEGIEWVEELLRKYIYDIDSITLYDPDIPLTNRISLIDAARWLARRDFQPKEQIPFHLSPINSLNGVNPSTKHALRNFLKTGDRLAFENQDELE